MLVDTLIIIIVAFGSLAVTYLLFNSVAATAPTAALAEQPAAAAGKKQKQQQQQQLSPKQKQQQQQKKKQEAALKAKAAKELDAFVARETSTVQGMTKDKAPLVTLEQLKAKAQQQAKKEAPVAKTTFSEEQKVNQKAHGFKAIQKPVVAKTVKQSGEPKLSKKAALDKKLSQFFKGGAGANKSSKPHHEEEEATGNGGTVTMKQAFKTTDPRGLWTGEHEW